MKLPRALWYWLGFALALRLILIPLAFHGDLNNSVIWGLWARQYGLSGYYDFLSFFNYARPNQPPLTILLYDGMRYLFEFIFSILWQIHLTIRLVPGRMIIWLDRYGFMALLKLPSVMADLGLGILIYKLAESVKKGKGLVAAKLYLFNPIVWYNSSLWGQTDAVLMLLAFSAVLAFYYRKNYLGALLFALAVMFKATILIFLPVVLLILLKQKVSFKKIAISIAVVLATVWTIAKPFAVKPTFIWLWELYTTKIAGGELHILTANAFNFWALVFGLTPIRDLINLFGLPAIWWGAILFGIFLVYFLYRFWKDRQLERLLLVWVMISFAAFLFLTRMHERYLFFLFAPLGILAATRPRLMKYYLILSVLHLLNLYNGWWVPNIGFLRAAMENSWTPRILSLLLLLVFAHLFYKDIKLKLIE